MLHVLELPTCNLNTGVTLLVYSSSKVHNIIQYSSIIYEIFFVLRHTSSFHYGCFAYMTKFTAYSN